MVETSQRRLLVPECPRNLRSLRWTQTLSTAPGSGPPLTGLLWVRLGDEGTPEDPGDEKGPPLTCLLRVRLGDNGDPEDVGTRQVYNRRVGRARPWGQVEGGDKDVGHFGYGAPPKPTEVPSQRRRTGSTRRACVCRPFVSHHSSPPNRSYVLSVLPQGRTSGGRRRRGRRVVAEEEGDERRQEVGGDVSFGEVRASVSTTSTTN